MPQYEGTVTSIDYTDTYNDCTLMTVKGTTQEDFEAYLAKMSAFSNYEQIVAPRDMLGGTGNIAAMYTKASQNGTYLINALWIPAANSINGVNEVKVTIEPLRDTDLSVFDPETATTEKTVDPLLIQIGLDGYGEVGSVVEGACDQNTAKCMAYAYRLSDGRFIVIDGGGNDYTGNGTKDKDHAARVYNTLKKYTPNNTIVIAAWFITHPHVDHMGGFMAFTKTYISDPTYKVSLQKVICNLPNVVEQTYIDAGESYSLSEKKVSTYNNQLEFLREHGVDIYKAHVGQMYYIGNMTVEILFTYDLLSPTLPDALFVTDAYGVNRGTVHNATGSGGDFTNTFSLIFQATVNTDADTAYKAIWTGDATCYSIETVNAMYKAAMKSDFVQVPHHGGTQMGRGSASDVYIKYYHEIQVNHFYGAMSGAPQEDYPISVFPEYYHSDGSYGYVRAKYILWPSHLAGAASGIDGEPGDAATNDSRLTTWSPTYHLQEEAQAQGGDVYLARYFLTVFTLGETITVTEDLW